MLKAKPDHPTALQLQALIAHDEGDLAGAIELTRRAIALDPRNPLLLYNLAELCRRAKRLDEALAANRQALILEPQSPRALMSLGSTNAELGRHEEAMLDLRRAIAIAPDYAMAHFNLGNVFDALRQFPQALEAKSEAIRLDPNFPDAFCSRGITLYNMCRFHEAEIDWKHALALNPRHADAHTNLALSELRRGNFLEGFARYEWRWRSKDAAARPRLLAPWNGDDPRGKHLLIHAEQGFGDTLQFCRYLPVLRERGASLVFLLPPALQSLVAHSMPWLQLSPGPQPPSDIQSTLLSLPHLLKTTLDTIPARVPYIHAPGDAISRLGAVIGEDAELKVGLIWAGSPKHALDKDRSLPFSAFAPLLDLNGVRFFSLQIGERSRDISERVIDLSPHLTDFAETAGAIANLDLVISVDTSVAHLAGAMGKPVWILLPFLADWRWLIEREDSPWYPTARLFRQGMQGDWGAVVGEIAKALKALVERTSASMPSPVSCLSDRLAMIETARKAGHLAKADELCRELLESHPAHPETLLLRAQIARDAGDRKAAIVLMRQATASDGGDPLFYCGLAEMFRGTGLLDDALAASQRGLALHPDSPQALYGVGTMFCARDEHEKAIPHLQRAIALAPEAGAAHMNLAVACNRTARFEDAEHYWKKALSIDPSDAEAHRNLGMNYLLRGDFLKGFPHYQWRLEIKDGTSRPRLDRPWNREDLKSKKLLVHAEQGYGDTIQFCRYLPSLRQRGARLALRAPRSLRELIAHSMPWLTVEGDEASSVSDMQSTLASLPYLLKTTVESIPAPIPYIKAPPRAVSRLGAMIGQGAELKIGLTIAGNAEHPRDRDRSIAFATLAPLLAIERVRFFSLQLGAAAREVSPAVTDLSPYLTDFAQTAGAIANLDLVISVDTAVAHLAGAMGKPVWIMLPFVPDWRWLLERDDSPWYPTARLFRQKIRGDWGQVIREVADELASFTQGNTAALRSARKLTPETR